MTTKETNPKDALAGKKPRWFSFVPLRVLVGVGLAMNEGARKYGKHNYRKAGVLASVYVDAAVTGHLMPWFEGEDFDPESGLSHIDKAIASLMVLRDSMLGGNWVDDRPIKAPRMEEQMVEATEQWAAIQARLPSPVAPFTQITHGGPSAAPPDAELALDVRAYWRTVIGAVAMRRIDDDFASGGPVPTYLENEAAYLAYLVKTAQDARTAALDGGAAEIPKVG